MRNSINRLVVCQELYAEILSVLKAAYGTAWAEHKVEIQFFLEKEIKSFHDYLEFQESNLKAEGHIEYAANFSIKLQAVILDNSSLTLAQINQTNKKVTSLLHDEIQRQFFHSAMPFSIH